MKFQTSTPKCSPRGIISSNPEYYYVDCHCPMKRRTAQDAFKPVTFVNDKTVFDGFGCDGVNPIGICDRASSGWIDLIALGGSVILTDGRGGC